MQPLTCAEIIEASGGFLESGASGAVFTDVSTDSRSTKSGDLFIPIIGRRHDGHDFIRSSFEAGAAGVLTQKDIGPAPGKTVIRVKDTLKALRDIAGFYRKKFKLPVVGVTGSVGKTSTKDMIACVLGRKYKVLKTEGNYNNEIGLPLSIFNLDSSHEAAVFEMGMSGFGEISRLASIAKPDIAVITNIGLSHVEKLGSRQNILKAKMEILEGLPQNGLVVLNGDDNLLYGLKDLLRFKVVFYGMGEGLDYQAYNIRNAGERGTYFEITLGNTDAAIHVPVPGVHNIYNALAAIAVGFELKVSPEEIIRGISEFSPGGMRMNIISHKGFKIINDAYNASPQSTESAICVLRDIGRGGRTFAVLGDMLELGEYSEKAHYDAGRFAAENRIEYIIAVGKNSRLIAQGALDAGAVPANVKSFDSNMRAFEFVKNLISEGDTVLVKGSRGMKMEEIVNALLRQDC